MPVVNPGIRRFLGSAIQRLFNSASFFAPLTHSAIPTRAASGTTATFTRATTKTIENNDGYLVTLLAGEIGFPGARRVRNLVNTTSEDFSNAAWTKTLSTVTSGFTDPNGGTGAYRLQSTGAGGYLEQVIATTKIPIASAAVMAWYIKSNTAASQTVKFARFASVEAKTVTTSWQRLEHFTASAGGSNFYIQDTGGNNLDVLIYRCQIEDVTAQTTQTAGEYVSVGVPADWAGTDLVTNGTFDTDTTGWTLSSATAAVSSGEVTLTNTAAAYGTLRQAITTVVGTKYILSGTARVGSATIAYVQAGTYAGAGDLLALSTSSSSNTFLTGTFTATGTTTYLSVAPDATSGHTAIFDNIVVKPAYYHGSGVDGVKCFPTDLSGNPIPSTTLLGYQAEGARTNLCLQSQTFDNASWTKTRATVSTTSVVCPDGVTRTTSTIAEDGAAANSHLILQATPVLTAAAHTVSVYAKAAARSWFSIGFDGLNACFNLVTGAVGSVEAGLTASIASAGNGWYRCIVYRTVAVSASKTFALYVAEGDNDLTFNGLTQDSVYVFGAQVELGSFASSYIPTTTIAVARNADVLTYSSSGNISGTVGAAYCEIKNNWVTAVGTSEWALSFNTAGAGMLDAGDNSSLAFRAYDGTNVVTATAGNSNTSVVAQAMAWGGTTLLAARSGTVASGTFDGDMSPTAIYPGGYNQIQGTIRNVRIWQRALSSSELQAVTA